ncbi:MAG: HAD family hydrolase [Dehalococcoidia bacterium]|nr:HAD family hydrolase [Dehalococcoidia bacterium]
MAIKAILFDWGGTVMREFDASTKAVVWPHLEVMPNVEKVLHTLYADFILCIASNASASHAGDVKQALERVNIAHYFYECFTFADIGFSKPDRRFFQSILKSLDKSPEECVMVGDDYFNDISGAKRSGIHTVWYRGSHSEAQPYADAVIADMAELPSAIKQIEKML